MAETLAAAASVAEICVKLITYDPTLIQNCPGVTDKEIRTKTDKIK